MLQRFGSRERSEDGLLKGKHTREFRRGMFLLPSIFTVGNMFCGYACVVHAMRGELETAAPFIGIAIVLDMLDGRIARMTGTTSAFGLAPAVLAFAWGLSELGRVGWAAGFIYVSAAAMRLARFNILASAPTDKRYFVGMPSPPAAGVAAATVFAWPFPLTQHVDLRQIFSDPSPWQALAAVFVMLVPAALMVSTIRFRSFKTINFGWGPSFMPLWCFSVLVAAIYRAPQITLMVLAYGYLASAFIGMAWSRLRGRRSGPAAPASPSP